LYELEQYSFPEKYPEALVVVERFARPRDDYIDWIDVSKTLIS